MLGRYFLDSQAQRTVVMAVAHRSVLQRMPLPPPPLLGRAQLLPGRKPIEAWLHGVCLGFSVHAIFVVELACAYL